MRRFWDLYIFPVPGRFEGLRLPRPLRTVQDSFPSYGSSIWKILFYQNPAVKLLAYRAYITIRFPHCKIIKIYGIKRICFPLNLNISDSFYVLLLGHDSFMTFSSPSNIMFASVGDNIPPWGVPEFVGNSFLSWK